MNFSHLDRFFADILELGLPMYHCIVYDHHKPVYEKKGGYVDLAEKRTHVPGQKYFLFSCTKLITTAALLTLVEKGKIALSDPLSKYLPAFSHMNVLEDGALRPAKAEITLWNLFTMTAGFTYNLTSPEIVALQKEKGNAFSSMDLADALSREPLAFDPGARWQYSLCHDVLAAVAEAVTGVRFADFVRDTVFLPLGMKNSRFGGYPLPGEDFATQYHYDGQRKSVTKIALSNSYVLGDNHDSGGAGVVSTVEDYILFADAMANGGVGASGARILSPETISLWHKGALSPLQARTYNWQQFLGCDYGLGVYSVKDTAPGSDATIFGWNGAAGSMAMLCPERGVSLFYAQHTRENPEGPTCPALREALFAAMRG